MTQTLNWGVGSNDTVLLLTYFLNDPLELSVHVSTFPILLCVTDHL